MVKIDRETYVKLADDYRTIRGGIIRLLTFGNAGGTIATLSFIGTMIGNTPEQTYDRGAFTALCFFLAGLAAGWFGRMAEWRIATNRFNLAASAYDTSQPSVNLEVRTKADNALDGAIFLSLMFLVAGIVFGLFKLFELSAS